MGNQPGAPEPVTVAWVRLDVPGHDAATLSAAGEGWILEGAAAFVEAGLPCHLSYRVRLDSMWRTQSAAVRGWAGARRIDLGIRVTSDRQWMLDGAVVAAVQGCIDVDLGFTPATNLVPIRRLALPVGSSTKVVAAWLPFPDLELQPLDQVYLRSDETTYHYRSLAGTFRTDLAVSPQGFVIDYPGLWREERS